jgi:hypothetical protein
MAPIYSLNKQRNYRKVETNPEIIEANVVPFVNDAVEASGKGTWIFYADGNSLLAGLSQAPALSSGSFRIYTPALEIIHSASSDLQVHKVVEGFFADVVVYGERVGAEGILLDNLLLHRNRVVEVRGSVCGLERIS